MTDLPSDAFPEPGHDHAPCLRSTMLRAEAAFERKGLRLTPMRRQVLEEIAASHHAVGAYDILERLAKKQSTRLAPISVYRALDALVSAGVVHRLESRNAFFACHAEHAAPGAQQIVLACERCGTVAEIDNPDAFGAVRDAARLEGFAISRALIEVMGVCRACSGGAGSAHQG